MNQPPAVGQWRALTVDGRQVMAHLQVEFLAEPEPGALKWVAVLYPDPNRSAHYVRGESFASMDDAIALALSLITELPALPEPEMLRKIETPDGATVMVAFSDPPDPELESAAQALKRVRERRHLLKEGTLPNDDEPVE